MCGRGDGRLCRRATLAEGAISWPEERPTSSDHTIIRPVANPFQAEGGISVVKGDIGRAVVKVSAVAEEHRTIDAPARVFQSQDEFAEAFEAGELNEDMVVVLPGQGPKAMGMPELHRLTPYLGVMQNKGLKVALLTDGRMSGASGKVLAAIQITPEAADGGLIQRIQSGDRIVIDSEQGELACTQPLASGANLPNLVMARMLVWAGSYSRFLETVCLVLTLVRAWCYERDRADSCQTYRSCRGD